MYKTAVYTLAVTAMLFAHGTLPQDDRSTAAAQRAAEKMVAEERRVKGAESKFIQEHVAAVQGERKDESWARRQESTLRKAADADAALGRSLKGVDCRRSRCAIDIELDASVTGEEHARLLSSIDEWIAGNQPCGYTIVHDPAMDARSVRVFTDCAEQRGQ